MSTTPHATIEDLYHIPDNGKAEIVDGRIVREPPTGDAPSRASFTIAISLRAMEGKIPGRAYPDNVAYRVSLPGRGSFSPDASFHTGASTGMKFLEGAPVFAVEVRSEHDYGPAAEAALARKRVDYFLAGTLVVWVVDLLSDEVVRSYEASTPEQSRIVRRGEIAHAEPAVPGWRLAVDELFERW